MTDVYQQPTKCVVCRRDSHQGYACATCEQRLRDHLVDIVEFYAIAEHELVPGSSTGSRASEQGIGVRIAALDFLAGHDVVAVLASWERDWRETYGLIDAKAGATVQATLVEVVRFLGAWLHRACSDHPAVDDFAREVNECWSLARTAARMAPASKATSITCPADLEDGSICSCRIGVDSGESTVKCPRCRTQWDVLHLMYVAIATPGAQMWADPEACAAYFHISASTLRRWANAGRITRSHGRYELRSIHDAINAERKALA